MDGFEEEYEAVLVGWTSVLEHVTELIERKGIRSKEAIREVAIDAGDESGAMCTRNYHRRKGSYIIKNPKRVSVSDIIIVTFLSFLEFVISFSAPSGLKIKFPSSRLKLSSDTVPVMRASHIRHIFFQNNFIFIDINF